MITQDDRDRLEDLGLDPLGDRTEDLRGARQRVGKEKTRGTGCNRSAGKKSLSIPTK